MPTSALRDKYAFKYIGAGCRTPSPEELQVRQIAQDLKIPTAEAIEQAAPIMAALIDGPCWLVPVPASDSNIAANLALANAIAALVEGARVKSALRRIRPVESSCDRRRRGLLGLTIDEHAIFRSVGPMDIMTLYFIDNVATTGTTIAACKRALGWGIGLTYADASTRKVLVPA